MAFLRPKCVICGKPSENMGYNPICNACVKNAARVRPSLPSGIIAEENAHTLKEHLETVQNKTRYEILKKNIMGP